jgi:hypothetical protein
MPHREIDRLRDEALSRCVVVELACKFRARSGRDFDLGAECHPDETSTPVTRFSHDAICVVSVGGHNDSCIRAQM